MLNSLKLSLYQMLKKNFYIYLNKELIYLMILAFILFIGRWISSFYFFDEDLGLRVINESYSDGYFYFPYVKALSTLNFNNSFDLNVNDLKNISLPFGSILLHSIFFYFFGNLSFIILEFLCIFVFLIIFYKIFLKFEFSQIFSIIFSTSLFIMPSLFRWLELNEIPYISRVGDFYDLRFPRSLVVNLFLFFFIFFLLNINNKQIYNIKNFVIFGLILALSFTSFYYFFIIEILSLVLFLLYKSNFNLHSILYKKTKFYLILIFTFFILSFPFLFNTYFTEPDYNERLCVIDLTLNRKIILLNHLIKGLFKLEFLFVFFFITLLIYIINKKKIKNYGFNNVLYIILLGSILSPFFFVLLSPKSCLLYHFNNYIVILAFLNLLLLFLNIFKNFFSNYFLSIKSNKFYLLSFLIITVFFFNLKIFYDYRSKYKLKAYSDYRNYLNLTVLELQKEKSKNDNTSLMTFDPRLMVWAIMNDINYIKPISGQIVPKTHLMIENDLISTFKFLNKDEDYFIKFFENTKSGWRYLNPNTQLFFWMKYSANSLKTFENSRNFDNDIIKFIDKTSPLHAQSLAIPNDEFKRLRLKFKNFKDYEIQKPSIISLSNIDLFLNKSKSIKIYYCSIKVTNELVIYKLKENKMPCD